MYAHHVHVCSTCVCLQAAQSHSTGPLPTIASQACCPNWASQSAKAPPSACIHLHAHIHAHAHVYAWACTHEHTRHTHPCVRTCRQHFCSTSQCHCAIFRRVASDVMISSSRSPGTVGSSRAPTQRPPKRLPQFASTALREDSNRRRSSRSR